MNTHRVEVFYSTYDDAVVCFIAYYFHLVFFPAHHRFFQHYLPDKTCIQSCFCHFFQIFRVVGHTAAGATQSKTRPDNDGKTQLTGDLAWGLVGMTVGLLLPLVFFDLPGVHKPRHKMNARMMQEVRSSFDEVDLVLGDRSSPIMTRELFYTGVTGARRDLPPDLADFIEITDQASDTAVAGEWTIEVAPPPSATEATALCPVCSVGCGLVSVGSGGASRRGGQFIMTAGSGIPQVAAKYSASDRQTVKKKAAGVCTALPFHLPLIRFVPGNLRSGAGAITVAQAT